MGEEYPRVIGGEVVFSGFESSLRPTEIRRLTKPLLLQPVNDADFEWLRDVAEDRTLEIQSGYQRTRSLYRLVRNPVTAEVALKLHDYLIRSPEDCVCAEIYDAVTCEIAELRGLLHQHADPAEAAWYGDR